MTWNMPEWTWAALLDVTCHPPRRPSCPTGLQMFPCGSRRRRRPARPHLERKRSWTSACQARGARAAGAGGEVIDERRRKSHHSASQPIFTMRRPTATRSEKGIVVCGALGRGGRGGRGCHTAKADVMNSVRSCGSWEGRH